MANLFTSIWLTLVAATLELPTHYSIKCLAQPRDGFLGNL